VSSKTIQRKPSKQRQQPHPTLQLIQIAGNVTGGLLLGTAMLVSSLTAGVLVGLSASFRNLPDVRALKTFNPSETSYIYDIKGRLLTRIHGEANREVVPLKNISPNLKRAVLAIEDSYFYTHQGIHPISIVRASLANLRQGRTVEGASTITMQLVKNLFLSQERRVSRKVAEAILALRIEQIFKKNEILELYLNQVYWGHNNYGAQTAALSYFNKPVSQLNLAEAAMMAGFIQAPEEWSPFVCTPTCVIDPKRYQGAKKRQAVVLKRMEELKWITPAEAQAALKQPIKLGRITSFRGSALPYVTEAAVQELARRFGRETVVKGGMRIQVTIDTQMQKMAENTVRWGHEVLLSQGVYADQMALVAVDPRTHFVKALVGGVDYNRSQFNRALQARRQPGSAFKPIVYYAAFASGHYGPESTIHDSPVSYRDGNEWYSPRNYDNTFAGPMSIRQALATSRNIPAIVLGREVGLDKVVEICRVLGIESPIDPVLSLPLGSVDLTPLELAGAYATFANYGWQSDTTFIAQVTDSRGDVLIDNTPNPRLVLDPWAAAALNTTLTSVIEGGTATSAQIGRQAAGKTGTTSSERDIWFVGYVPQLVVAVWAGNDDYTSIGHGATGGGFMAPIWRDFMLQALRNVPAEYFRSPSQFTPPQG
jgi:penicillin-binding protein 1A